MSGASSVGPADHVEADVVLEQRRQLRAQVALQQQHQRAHLGRRPLPVLDRERVEREHARAPAAPRSRATSRTDSMPARWPSTRGRCRRPAQRPLPSMMMATCRGSAIGLDLPGELDGPREPGGIHARSCSSDMGGTWRFYIAALDRLDQVLSGSGFCASAVRPVKRSTRPQDEALRRRGRAGRGAIARRENRAISSAGQPPRPMSTSVPTMLRTMCRRKPVPVTRSAGSRRRARAQVRRGRDDRRSTRRRRSSRRRPTA